MKILGYSHNINNTDYKYNIYVLYRNINRICKNYKYNTIINNTVNKLDNSTLNYSFNNSNPRWNTISLTNLE